MRVLVAGDFYPSGKVKESLGKGDFESVFSDIKEITGKVDYSVVNLECPVTGALEPISKVGPALKCEVKALDALKYAGFDCVTLANNHINDYDFIWAIDGGKLKIETNWLYTLNNDYSYIFHKKLVNMLDISIILYLYHNIYILIFQKVIF